MKLQSILACVFFTTLLCPNIKTLKCYECTELKQFCEKWKETQCPNGTTLCYRYKQEKENGEKREHKGCTFSGACALQEDLAKTMAELSDSKPPDISCYECKSDLCNTAEVHISTFVLIAVGVLVLTLRYSSLNAHL